MKKIVKKSSFVLLLLFAFVFCFVASFFMYTFSTKADNEAKYLYQNNSGMTVTASVPTYFGTHITPSNGGGDHPGYFTLNDGGINGLTYLDTNSFFLSSGGTFCSQAVNVTLPNSLDISYVKTLTIKLNASHSRANLINDSTNEWFTLYGVNTDGTIANNGVGFEFNNTNIPASGDNTLVLTYDQFKYLADDNGIIKTLQWNYWDNKDGGAVTFVIQSIEYIEYTEDDYKTVTFYDTDETTVLLTKDKILSSISLSDFPLISSISGYDSNYSYVWMTLDGKALVPNAGVSENINVYPVKCLKSSTENGFLYKNNSGMTVTDSVPTYFGTHITPSNGGGDHPGYFTLNGGGIGGLTYLDTNNFFLSSGGSTPSQAVNVTLPNSLDISYVKTLTIKLNASHSRANLINDSTNEWFTLYGVNTDGTIANNGVGFEFNNTNIPASGDNTLVLTYDQFKLLADDNGIIKTLQWNYWDNKDGGSVTFVIQSISYEVYSQDEYKLVTFKDTNCIDTLSKFAVGNTIPENLFPLNSTISGINDGYSVQWVDSLNNFYDVDSIIECAVVLYPIFADKINISNGVLYSNNGSYQVVAEKPTHFGTHFEFEDSVMSHPGYFTENANFGTTYNVDGGALFLSTNDEFPSKAVNITFPNSLDITYIKTISIRLNASFTRDLLVNDDSEWYTLFGVNSDGTIANNGVGFEFNNTNIPASGDNTLVLTYDQFKYLADDNGIIKTLQWNYWDTNSNGNGVTFVIQNISYTVYNENELKIVSFYDVDGETLLLKTAGANYVIDKYIPQIDVDDGYTIGWYDEKEGAGNKLNKKFKIEDSMSFYGNKEYIEYTISFMADNTLVEKVKYTKADTSIIEPTVPLKDNYVGKWEQYELSGGDLIVNAVYSPIEYSLIFKCDEKIVDTVKYTIETLEIEEPTAIDKDFFTVVWEEYELEYTDNQVVNAIYIAIEYEISFVVDDEILEKVKYTVNDFSIEEPNVPSRDYYIASWEEYELVGGNFDVNAVYTAIVYNVTFKAEDVEDIVLTYTIENKTDFELPNVPVKEGYTVKWDKNLDEILIFEDIEVNAVYEKNTASDDDPEQEHEDEKTLGCFGGIESSFVVSFITIISAVFFLIKLRKKDN